MGANGRAGSIMSRTALAARDEVEQDARTTVTNGDQSKPYSFSLKNPKKM